MSDGDAVDDPSVAARDELAGVLDLFGSLTRAELSAALSELAFKRRTDVDEAAIEAAIDVAITEYAIVPAPAEAVSPVDDATGSDGTGDEEAGRTLLAVGPAAFPSLPDGAEDLPHILEVPDRHVDRDALANAVLDRLADDAVAAITAADSERLATLADVTYDVEAWAPVDAEPIRDRIVAELDE